MSLLSTRAHSHSHKVNMSLITLLKSYVDRRQPTLGSEDEAQVAEIQTLLTVSAQQLLKVQ